MSDRPQQFHKPKIEYIEDARTKKRGRYTWWQRHAVQIFFWLPFVLAIISVGLFYRDPSMLWFLILIMAVIIGLLIINDRRGLVQSSRSPRIHEPPRNYSLFHQVLLFGSVLVQVFVIIYRLYL